MASSARVLVIDDEQGITDFIKQFVEDLGLSAVAVNVPEEGVKLAQNERFLTIITDYHMPKMNGIDVIAKVKQTNLNANTPFIVLSGALTDDLLTNLEKLGVINVMSKPPDLEIFENVLKKAQSRLAPTQNQSGVANLSSLLKAVFERTAKDFISPETQVESVDSKQYFSESIEYSSLVSIFGTKISGVVSISFAKGFTHEFAQKVLMRTVTQEELGIFEQSTGELASSVAKNIIASLGKEHGLAGVASPAMMLLGRHANMAMPGFDERISMAATLNGKKCILDAAFIDMSRVVSSR